MKFQFEYLAPEEIALARNIMIRQFQNPPKGMDQNGILNALVEFENGYLEFLGGIIEDREECDCHDIER